MRGTGELYSLAPDRECCLMLIPFPKDLFLVCVCVQRIIHHGVCAVLEGPYNIKCLKTSLSFSLVPPIPANRWTCVAMEASWRCRSRLGEHMYQSKVLCWKRWETQLLLVWARRGCVGLYVAYVFNGLYHRVEQIRAIPGFRNLNSSRFFPSPRERNKDRGDSRITDPGL